MAEEGPTPSSTGPDQGPLTFQGWLIVGTAAMGFAFDIYVLLVLPLILEPALNELIKAAPGSVEYNDWAGRLFYVPALFGGAFGLVGGYLTDLFGRRRVLVWSILLYAFSTLASGYSSSVQQLLVFRCLTFVGVCVEFVAAVAWLAELFPEPARREKILGATQAFSSLGGLMVTGANLLAINLAKYLPAIQDGHDAWRYTLISGVIPAIPLMLVRPFLPESPAWKRKREAGQLKRPNPLVLLQRSYRRTTVITTILFAMSFGAAFGAIQHAPRIATGLVDVKGLSPAEQKTAKQKAANAVQLTQEIGGLAGRVIFAFLVVRVMSQRKLLRLFQVPGLILFPLVFVFAAPRSLALLELGIFLCGLFTIAQLSFWGNYLPRVYPTHLRGTGEGFAANIGGRMIGTSAALLTTSLANVVPGNLPFEKLAYAAAIVGFLTYAIGSMVCFWLPEPEKRELPE